MEGRALFHDILFSPLSLTLPFVELRQNNELE